MLHVSYGDLLLGILRFHNSRPSYVWSSTDTLNLAGGGAKRRHKDA